jgi:hypothetical protein
MGPNMFTPENPSTDVLKAQGSEVIIDSGSPSTLAEPSLEQ